MGPSAQKTSPALWSLVLKHTLLRDNLVVKHPGKKIDKAL